MRKIIIVCVTVLTFGIVGTTNATVTLDFEGIGDHNYVGDFYNGGGGADYGVSFSDNALALVDADAGGTGNFGGEPSPDTVLFFLEGEEAVMSYADGFDIGFSFFYVGLGGAYVNIFDDVGGTGNILASFSLPETENNDAGADPTGFFGPFEAIGIEFDGLAKSVAFGGSADQVGFDNITFGSATPPGGDTVPEPGTMILLGVGLGAMICIRRMRK